MLLGAPETHAGAKAAACIFQIFSLFSFKPDRFRANLKLRRASGPFCCKPLRPPPWYVYDCQRHPSHIDSMRTRPALSGWCLNLAPWTAIRQRTATRARSDGEARGFYSCLQTTPDWSCPAEADLLPFEEIVQMPKMVSSLEDIGSPKNQFATNGRS